MTWDTVTQRAGDLRFVLDRFLARGEINYIEMVDAWGKLEARWNDLDEAIEHYFVEDRDVNG